MEDGYFAFSSYDNLPRALVLIDGINVRSVDAASSSGIMIF